MLHNQGNSVENTSKNTCMYVLSCPRQMCVYEGSFATGTEEVSEEAGTRIWAVATVTVGCQGDV